MKISKLWFGMACLLAVMLCMPRAHAAVPLIMDQDISSDHDDVGDLAVANALADLGECDLLACVANSTNGASALVQNTICAYYGRPNVPCGRRADVGGMGGYAGTICTEFPHPLYKTYLDCPLDVAVYRHALASQADHSVVIVTTGYLNNLQNLMLSGPDAESPLNGMALIRQKVALWSCAGGWFPNGDEFNLRVEPGAAHYVVNNWPTSVPVMFHNFPDGSAIFSAGRLQATANNPVRRAWELTNDLTPGWYPTWGQMAVIYGVRAANRATLFSAVTVGHAQCDALGHSSWLTDTNPGTQGYTLERERYVKQQENDSLLMDCAAPKCLGTIHPPNQPSNLRATSVGSRRIDLQWTDNSWNATGFVIERKMHGVYRKVGTVGAHVTRFSETGLPTTANQIYRVVAVNRLGRSDYDTTDAWQDATTMVFPHGWTETNLGDPNDHTPIYRYDQNMLNWVTQRPGTNHVTVNNDASHGTEVTINVNVAADGGYGDYYVYFFYQDQLNWYRLNGGNAGEKHVSRFEKCLAGKITPIGADGEGVNLGQGSMAQSWKIVVSSGHLQWFTNGNQTSVIPDATPHLALQVNDTLSFTSGKLALGSNYGQPFWYNFNYDASAP